MCIAIGRREPAGGDGRSSMSHAPPATSMPRDASASLHASTKKRVWRGAARSPLDSEASAEQKQELVDEAMQKLFKKFPSKKK